ncbi:MAG: hypothetical protein ACTSQG_08380 [Promethearchaeota archaeon]
MNLKKIKILSVGIVIICYISIGILLLTFSRKVTPDGEILYFEMTPLEIIIIMFIVIIFIIFLILGALISKKLNEMLSIELIFIVFISIYCFIALILIFQYPEVLDLVYIILTILIFVSMFLIIYIRQKNKKSSIQIQSE